MKKWASGRIVPHLAADPWHGGNALIPSLDKHGFEWWTLGCNVKIRDEKAGEYCVDARSRDPHLDGHATPSRQPGFTLVELLVALTLFAVLMSGVLMLFVGSVRSAKTTYQQIDAFEKARSALTIVQNDLVTSFASHQSDDLHCFYGTPIGMTFVGLIPSSASSGNFSVARITYVVYNTVISRGVLTDNTTDVYAYRFPDALENALVDADGNPIGSMGDDGTWQQKVNMMSAYPYPLLRYVETGVTDLNTFPIPWNASVASGTTAVTYRDVLDKLCGFASDSKQLTEQQRERVWMATCEMWIRMLAGGDEDVPMNFWTDTNIHTAVMNPLDYMVADNILSVFPPNRLTAAHFPGTDVAAEPDGNRQQRPFCGAPYFDYDMESSYTDNLDANGSGKKVGNVWWNDVRSNAVHVADDTGKPYQWDCLNQVPTMKDVRWDPRLPETVMMSFWLMFESPYPGAPDFKRHFSLQINIPAAFERPME